MKTMIFVRFLSSKSLKKHGFNQNIQALMQNFVQISPRKKQANSNSKINKKSKKKNNKKLTKRKELIHSNLS